jgi:hypothetical protein
VLVDKTGWGAALVIDDRYSPNIAPDAPEYVNDMIDINNRGGGDGVYVTNASWGAAFNFDNFADGRGLFGYNRAVGDGINIYNQGSGHGIYVFNEGSGIGFRSHNFGSGPSIVATGATTATMLHVEQNGAGNFLEFLRGGTPLVTISNNGSLTLDNALNATGGIHLWNVLDSGRVDGNIYLNYTVDRGKVDIFNGAVWLGAHGDVHASGTITTSSLHIAGTGNAAIEADEAGNVSATGEITASAINIGDVGTRIDSSGNLTLTGYLAMDSPFVGSARFGDNTTVLTVTVPTIRVTSKVFLTATAAPSGIWYVEEKIPGNGFRVVSSEPELGTTFDYWVIP